MVNKILFIHTPCPQIEDDCLEPPLGLLLLGTFIKKHGFRPKILDLSGNSLEKSKEKVREVCKDYDYIGFSTYTGTYNITKELVKITKKNYPKKITFAGGPHATALPEEVAKYFDYVIVGEGEEGILRLLKGKKEKIIFSQLYPNLDKLPLPNYSLVDLDKYTRVVNGKKSLSILTTRGCPYNCHFCNSTVFSKKKFRKRSPLNVAKEIKMLYNKYNIKSFRFQDDLFTFDSVRIKQIFSLCPKVEYRCFARADTLTKETCKVLKETGCLHVSIGVESCSDSILKKMNKGLKKEDIKRGIVNAHEAGLVVRIYLIVGFPGETDKTVNKTIEFLKDLPFDEFVVYPLIPYPGTRVYSNPKEFGITKINKDFSKYIQVGRNRFTGFVMETSTFDSKKVQEWRKKVISILELQYNKKWSSTKSKFK